jgi:DNA replication protein DnaC
MERRRDRLVDRRCKLRDMKTLDTFNWTFNASDRAQIIYELAGGRFIEQHEDVLMLGNSGVGKSHLAQAISMAAIHAGFRVIYREAHRLFEDIVLATALGERSALINKLADVPLLVVDDLGMRKLPTSAAEHLLEVIMRRYERASTIVTSNRPARGLPQIVWRHSRRYGLPRSTHASRPSHRDARQELPAP